MFLSISEKEKYIACLISENKHRIKRVQNIVKSQLI